MLKRIHNLISKDSGANELFKTLFVFMIVIMIIVTFVTVTIYMTFVKDLTSTHQFYMRNEIDKFTQDVNSTKLSANNFAGQIFFDSDIAKVINGINNDNDAEDKLFNRLSYYSSMNPYIESIYIYKSKSKELFISSSKGSNNKYDLNTVNYDNEISSLIKDQKTRENLFLLRNISSSVDKQNMRSEYIYTFVFFPYKKIPDAVVINYYKQIFTVTDNKELTLFVVNNEGNTIISSRDASINLKPEYMDKIIGKKDSKGSFIDYISGRKSLIVYSKYKNETFVNEILYDSILGKVNESTYKIIIVIFISLLMLVVVLALASKFAYKRFHSVFDQIKELKASVSHFRRNKKMEFIKSVILNSEDKKIAGQLNIDYGLPISMIMVKIDQYDQFNEFYSSKEQSAMKFGIYNVIEELFLEKSKCEITEINLDEFVVIYNSIDNINEIISKIKSVIKDNLEVSLSVFIGNTIQDIVELRLAYNELKELSEYRYFEGYGCTLDLFTYKTNSKQAKIDISNMEKDIISCIQNGDADGAISKFDEGLLDFKSITPYNLKLEFIQLSATLNKLAAKIRQSLGVDIPYPIYDIIIDLEKSETIDQAKNIFNNIFTEMTNSISSSSVKKHDDFARQVKKMIEENYSDPNFCIDVVAEKFGITLRYATQIFKKVTLESISNYLLQYRMDKAKQFVECTDMMVGEISEKVGFTSDSYFIQSFKKYYGTTPNQYRKKRKY